MNTIWAVVKDGKILPNEPIELQDGQRVLVTILNDEEKDFWRNASASSLDTIWDNLEDDVYAELLAA
ncbi:MAG: hypothetical protein KA586_11490 [Candidatus Promineofilum sp.]|nr:hypothetical protein [Promineifilum sp.]